MTTTPASAMRTPPTASRIASATPLPVRLARIAIATGLLLLGALAIAFESTLRIAESRVLAVVVERIFSGEAVAAWSAEQPAVAYRLGDSWFSVRITIQCSIALYLGPVALLAGLLVLSPRIRIGRVVVAAVAGMAGLVVLNQVRLVLIAFAYGAGGMDAFHWMHGPVGSALMLLGIAAVLVAFFVLCLNRRSGTRARR